MRCFTAFLVLAVAAVVADALPLPEGETDTPPGDQPGGGYTGNAHHHRGRKHKAKKVVEDGIRDGLEVAKKAFRDGYEVVKKVIGIGHEVGMEGLGDGLEDLGDPSLFMPDAVIPVDPLLYPLYG